MLPEDDVCFECQKAFAAVRQSLLQPSQSCHDLLAQGRRTFCKGMAAAHDEAKDQHAAMSHIAVLGKWPPGCPKANAVANRRCITLAANETFSFIAGMQCTKWLRTNL